jgi:hypothetical protein
LSINKSILPSSPLGAGLLVSNPLFEKHPSLPFVPCSRPLPPFPFVPCSPKGKPKGKGKERRERKPLWFAFSLPSPLLRNQREGAVFQRPARAGAGGALATVTVLDNLLKDFLSTFYVVLPPLRASSTF